MQRTLRATLAAASVATLVACGGGSDGGPSFSTTADSATIAFLADNSSTLVETTVESVFLDGSPGLPLPFGSKGALSARGDAKAVALAYLQRLTAQTPLRGKFGIAGLRAPSFSAPFSECIPTLTGVDEVGDPIDTDGDNVPDDFKQNFGSACVSEDSAGTERLTVSGYLRFQDTNIGLYSFKATLGHLKVVDLDIATGNYFSIEVNGTESFTAASSLASHSMNFTETISQKTGSTTIGAQLIDNETSSFDPDGASVIDLGSSLPAAAIDYNADFRVIGENSGGELPGNFQVILSTPTKLHYNPACGSDIDAGVVRGLLSGKATVGFTATWTGCGTVTTEIFGDTPATATAAR